MELQRTRKLYISGDYFTKLSPHVYFIIYVVGEMFEKKEKSNNKFITKLPDRPEIICHSGKTSNAYKIKVWDY